MTYLQALVLGVLQGITEFLPISSSGHLVLLPFLLGWEFDAGTAFVFDVLVQWGTTFAVIIYFWTDLKNIFVATVQSLIRRDPFSDSKARLGWLILLASLPAALAGFLLKDIIAATFVNPLVTSIALLFTAALLTWGERVASLRLRIFGIAWQDALWIGVFQVLALLPGVSRSGSTISGGLWRGLRRPAAARFSFLMSVPVMLGAGLVALRDLVMTPGLDSQIGPTLAGGLAALVVGMLSIHWLLRYLARRSLRVFAIYCAVVGTGGMLLYALSA
jgi:undecaprenyl-diphosphatase